MDKVSIAVCVCKKIAKVLVNPNVIKCDQSDLDPESRTKVRKEAQCDLNDAIDALGDYASVSEAIEEIAILNKKYEQVCINESNVDVTK